MRLLVLLGLIAVLPLRADGLADLKAQLDRLQGSEPVKVSVERQIWNCDGEEKKAVVTQGSATAWVEEGPQGLKLFWSRDQVQRAAQEERAKERDGKGTTPTALAISTLNVGGLEGYFNSAEKLSQDLRHAKFLTERTETLDGRLLRVLTFAPESNPEEQKMFKERETALTIWIDAEGLPVAKRLHQKGKGRILLVASFEGETSDEYRYSRLGTRLVTLHHQHEERFSGSLGGGNQNHHQKQTTTLKYN